MTWWKSGFCQKQYPFGSNTDWHVEIASSLLVTES